MMTELSCEQCSDLMADYVDESLSADLRPLVTAHLPNCDTCQAHFQNVWQMHTVAMQWQDETVPSWSRRNTFFESQQWMMPLQMFSAFASVSALTLVILLTLGQIQITTGASAQTKQPDYLTKTELNQRIEHLETKLAQQQQNQMQASLSNLTQQQIETNKLLLHTILQQSRDERREDLDTVLTTWDLVQDRRNQQTQDSIGALFVSQIEDKRNIKQLNKFLNALGGNNL